MNITNIFYTQFREICIIIKVFKNFFFKIIGFHHTLNNIAICERTVNAESIYKIYWGVYHLLPGFKALSLLISLPEVKKKDKKEGM